VPPPPPPRDNGDPSFRLLALLSAKESVDASSLEVVLSLFHILCVLGVKIIFKPIYKIVSNNVSQSVSVMDLKAQEEIA
jgi:hypothetical protein